MKLYWHRFIFILLASIAANTILLISIFRSVSILQAADDNVLCVVPKGESPGPFAACSQVFDSIQAAVDAAAMDSIIWVASGTYTDTQLHNVLPEIVYIDKPITIRGGYVPPFTAPPNPEQHPTVLDAHDQGRGVYITGTTATLVGLQITGGNATGLDSVPSNNMGGGVYGANATVTISQSVIFSNVAAVNEPTVDFWHGAGGGLAFERSKITLTESVIQDNVASWQERGSGGGIFLAESQFTLTDNQFLRNTALMTSSSSIISAIGGGVALYNSSGELIHNLIDSNVALEYGVYSWGGGVGVWEGNWEEDNDPDKILLHDNQIQNNIALVEGDLVGGLGSGGGITFYSFPRVNDILTITMTRNLIQHNTAATTGQFGTGGGMTVLSEGSSDQIHSVNLTFQNNIVRENISLVNGQDPVSGDFAGFVGGLEMYGGKAYLEGNQIVSNTAGFSKTRGYIGGLGFSHVQLTERNDIIRYNDSDGFGYGSGGAVYFDNTKATLTNVVIADNQSQTATLHLSSSQVRLLHPTIARNDSESAIYLEDPDFQYILPSNLTLTNAIIVDHPVGITVGDYSTVTVEGVMWHDVPLTVDYGPLAHVTVNHEFVHDPLLAADGYHLLAESAARGKGVPLGIPTDIDGEPRRQIPDLGADEYWLDNWYLAVIKQASSLD